MAAHRAIAAEGIFNYLQMLISEREKLAPFLDALPFCARLLTEEMRKMESLYDYLRAPAIPSSPVFYPNSPLPSSSSSHSHSLSSSMLPPSLSSQRDITAADIAAGFGAVGNGGGGGGGGGGMGGGGMGMGPVRPRRIGSGPIVKLSERIVVPAEKYPEFNFVGRILGPRGATIQQIQNDTGCRISIRGKGSLRTKEEEEQKLKTKSPGYEHLSEELHVLVEVEMPEDEAQEAIRNAKEIVESLLVPPNNQSGMDALKMQQLNELAIMHNKEFHYPPSQAPHAGKQRRPKMQQHSPFFGYK